MGLYKVNGFQGAQIFRLSNPNTMAYFLDINDPSKLYTKTIDMTGTPAVKSYTITEDQIVDENGYVTQQMLEEILDDKFEKFFKKYNNRSRNRNRNQNREVDDDA